MAFSVEDSSFLKIMMEGRQQQLGGTIENGHAEVTPPMKEEEEGWYLLTFDVYHPKKPGQISVVFDSSDKYDGVSLNLL